MPRRHSRYIPKAVKEEVRRRDRNRCRNCSATDYLEFDHITPHSKGAPAIVDNIQLLCRKCNIAKRHKGPKCPECGIWTPEGARHCHECGITFRSKAHRKLDRPKGGWSLEQRLVLMAAIIRLLMGAGIIKR